jgi:hypothetical protein
MADSGHSTPRESSVSASEQAGLSIANRRLVAIYGRSQRRLRGRLTGINGKLTIDRCIAPLRRLF